ncbi:guanitoxin biosynthesis L-enduracididine beta-hydroxylase GntD [Streptomyces sp. NPDC008163]|uniref:guanitoxin biosynthesis L-enduracididine beta-hydroxylase GntD n=1 Tax=Streptomyces sp. NPDC008163 TaxID=3364818 RepID=UPI0036E7B1FA
MHKLTLLGSEYRVIEPLLDRLATRYLSIEDPRLIREAPLLAHELPLRIKEFMRDYVLDEPSGICLISGYPIDDAKLGRTPEHWRDKAFLSPTPTLREEIFFLLCASLLGDVFAWSTQQDGTIMHDVLPIKGHEQEQLGSGSEQTLWWHTEDAFHPFKGDYVSLMCLRNPDGVATTVAAAERIAWDELDLDTLFSPLYTIRPDESHLPKNRAAQDETDPARARLLDAAYDRITAMTRSPERVPVLHGDRTAPYMCLDPYFMKSDDLEPTARKAFDGLVAAIETSLEALVLEPGDCCFIDNLRAVHGRDPFKARFDGKDRWLKRLNITRNLRGSRAARVSSADRVIF